MTIFHKTITIAMGAFICFLLAGCVASIDEALPYERLPEITVATQFNLVASPSHPTAYLSADSIPAGEQIQVIGADKDAAWLLVLHDNILGWMPTFYSRTNVATLKPPIVVEPLSDKCTKYLDATFAPDEAWVSNISGAAIVVGSIYRQQVDKPFEAASLKVEIDGNGIATAADYVHAPLTASSAVVLFAYAIDGLQKGSQIRFNITNPGNETLAFEAAFFSNTCPDHLSQLPIGHRKVVVAEQESTSAPTDLPPAQALSTQKQTPTPTPKVLLRENGRAITPTPSPTKLPTVVPGTVSKWFVRAYNIDEMARVYVNDEQIFETPQQRDSGWIDITAHLLPGQKNLLRLSVWNYSEEYTWGFAIKADNSVLWENEQGQVGFKGANDNDTSKKDQAVYYKAFLIDEKGQLSELPGSSSKWFVKVSAIDDLGTAYMYGIPIVSVGYQGDSGWLDITNWVHDGYESKVEFIDRNGPAGATWNMALRRDSETVWSNEGTSSQTGIVYQQILYITPQGEVSVIPEKTRWFMRVGLADDTSRAYINDELALERNYGEEDKGWVEITQKLKPGQENILRFSGWNGPSSGAWNFALMRNNEIAWEGVGGSNLTGRMVYDYLVFISPDGEVAGDSSSSRWFVQASDIDDTATIYVNGEKIIEVPVHNSSDWIDITDQMPFGQENKIRFTNWNGGQGASWHFAIRRNNSIVWEETGQSNQSNQMVYDETLTINDEEELVAP